MLVSSNHATLALLLDLALNHVLADATMREFVLSHVNHWQRSENLVSDDDQRWLPHTPCNAAETTVGQTRDYIAGITCMVGQGFEGGARIEERFKAIEETALSNRVSWGRAAAAGAKV